MELGPIGLGIMGTPMAINLARASHQPHVTTTGPVADELLSLGTVNVEIVRQVTDISDIISTMAPDIPQVEDVLPSENDCTKALLKDKTIVDMNSISPTETKCSARQMSELGDDHLDVPVSGNETDMRERTLSIMAGGNEAVFEHVKPLSELFGKSITLVGDNDDGRTCKVANQIIMAPNTETVSGVLLFASKAGADPVRVHRALMGGFAPSRILEIYDGRMIKRTFSPGFKIAPYQKDLNLVLQSAKTLALNLPNTAACRELFNTCAANGGNQLDRSVLVQASELMADHKLA